MLLGSKVTKKVLTEHFIIFEVSYLTASNQVTRDCLNIMKFIDYQYNQIA